MAAGISVVVAIHQLHYLPWLRYFDKIAAADVFIVLDNIQFNKNGWQNRNRIKTANGPLVLTVPVRHKAGQPLDAVRIDNTQPWRAKHLKSLEQAYARAPYAEAHLPFLRRWYGQLWDSLNALNKCALAYFVEALGIASRVVYASEMAPVPGVATERLVNLIQAVGGTCYYSGSHAAETYLDEEPFRKAGIGLLLQRWTPPTYPQIHGPFAPDLSIVDLLMNCGPDSRDILRRAAA